MTLAPGTRIGPYEVHAPLGAGGMGEVYRATDTTLGRRVAIKILPEAVAADPHRMARFEREAKALASLNHPHIAVIFGFETHPGAGGLGVRALVMELVEGEDLSQRLALGAMPLDEALAAARQIAEALEAAHEQGIVHRDLKPANIMVRSDGTVKVLDFGLAKAVDQGSASSDQGSTSFANSPTITSPAMTKQGVILGTAAYMAPEQAKGKAVDRRSDVWALGAVLFEMLTGERAFKGEDATDIIAAVVGKEPDWSLLPPHTPPVIRRLLRRCLEKDRKRRLDSAADARLEIEEAIAAPHADQSLAPTPGTRLPWALATGFGLALVATLLVWAPWQQEALSETRVDMATPNTTDPMASFAVSPDGRSVVFVSQGGGSSRLWLRSLAATTAQPLAGTEGAMHPFWSPDSRSVGFFDAVALKRIDLAGGAPQVLASVSQGRGGTWSDDGVIVFATVAGPLMRLPAGGGITTPVTTLAPQQPSHRWPQLLPDGQTFIFYSQGPPSTSGIYLAGLDGRTAVRLTPAESAGVALSGRWLLWVQAGALLAQRIDVATATLVGEPVTVADSAAVDAGGLNRSAVSVANTGLIAYRTGISRARQLTWFDRTGMAIGTIGEPDRDGLVSPLVSPDGRRVVAARTLQGNQDLWVLDADRTSRFTFEAATERFAVWSPDGARVVFRSNRTGLGELYEKLASGAGGEEMIFSTGQITAPSSWSSDGRYLLYTHFDPATSGDLWVLPMTGPRPAKPVLLLRTAFREFWGTFSPDGKWVAYQSDESGRNEIYVRPFVPPNTGNAGTGTGGRWQVSAAGGISPVWRPDGRELYFLNPASELLAAPIVVNGSTLEPGSPIRLFRARVLGGGDDTGLGPQYDVARDGRILINIVIGDEEAPLTLLLNWRPPSS